MDNQATKPLSPLFGLQSLKASGRVFVCPSEAAASAAHAIGLQAVSPSGGATIGETAWEALLAFDDVILVAPDNKAGGAFIVGLYQYLRKILNFPNSILHIRPPRPQLPPTAYSTWHELSPVDEGVESLFISVDGRGEDVRTSLKAMIAAVNQEMIDLRANGQAPPVVKRASDASVKAVRWLWPNRIPLGKLTLIAGDPSVGKSFLTAALAAHVSTGSPWPDTPEQINPAVGSVVMLSDEDDFEDTIRPRLDAAGANVHRVALVTGVKVRTGEDDVWQETPFTLADLPQLEQAILSMPRTLLVTIDPVTSYLPGRTDSHKTADVRAVLMPLAKLAARLGVAIVGITHLNKSPGGQAMYRATGSLAFIAAARVAWLVARDKDDRNRRLMLPIKCNLGPEPPGLAFSIAESVDPHIPGIGVVSWEVAPVRMDTDAALKPADPIDQEQESNAINFLNEQLEQGAVPAVDIFREATAAGIKRRALQRAKQHLGVISRRNGAHNRWEWVLPAREYTTPPPNGKVPF